MFDQLLRSAVLAVNYFNLQEQRCICLPKSSASSGYLYALTVTVNEPKLI